MYSFQSKVRYSEASGDGYLSSLGIINYMQDCSTFHSETLHNGVKEMKEKHRAWILASWQIEILRRPKLGETITIETWPTGFRSAFGYRNFAIRGEDGEYAVKAYSIWIYINTDTGHPARVDEDVLNTYITEPPLEMDEGSRKVAVPKDLTKMEPVIVRKHQIDTNGHMNNSHYLTIADEWLPEDGQLKKLSIEYKKAAMHGDAIYPQVSVKEEESVVALCGQDGSIYCVVKGQKG